MDKEIRKWMLAAKQRLTGAELLFNHGLYLESIYLGGYVVEMALKGLILARTPLPKRPGARREILTHDFGALKELLAKRRCKLPLEVVGHLRRVASWSVRWRYEVGRVPEVEAGDFMEAVRKIRQWVERSI